MNNPIIPLFALCEDCKKRAMIGNNFVNERAYKKEICVNCGKEIKNE